MSEYPVLDAIDEQRERVRQVKLECWNLTGDLELDSRIGYVLNRLEQYGLESSRRYAVSPTPVATTLEQP